MSLKGLDGERILGSGSKAVPFEVLYTDYQNEAILWTCSYRWGLSRIEQLWVLTRKDFKNDKKHYHVWARKSLDL